MKNFLGTKERTIDFTAQTNIVGRNGSWKSSIKEAIIYALYGKINWQSQRLDTAIHNGEKDMSVILTVEQDGKTYIVERIHTSSGSSSKINGKSTDSDGFVEITFGTYEEFISQVCAGDFMKFDEGTRYAIINKVYPGDLKKIYVDMVGEAIAKKYPYDTLDKKQIEASIKAAQEKQNKIHFDKLNISSKIEELSQVQLPTISVSEIILEDMRNKIAEHQALKPVIKTEPTLDSEELSVLKTELAVEQKKLREHLDNKPSRSELDRIATLYKNAEQELNAMDKWGVCPTCRRSFNNNDKEVQVEQAKNKLSQLLDEWRAYKKQYENELFGWEEEQKRLVTHIESMTNKLNTLNESVAVANQGALGTFSKAMTEWQTVWDELMAEQSSLNETFKSEKVKLQAYHEAQDKIEEYKAKLWQMDKDLLAIDYHELDKVKECFGAKWIEFKDIESKLEKIRGFLPEGVELELLQQNKTNEGFKKVFNLKQNWVSYNWLSKWMRKILDIHLCEMLSDKKVIIVDDLESLTSSIQLVNTDVQIITMTAKDVDLTIS